MAQYISKTPRITVKFIDTNSEEIICELKDKNWMNVGEVLSSHVTNSIVMNELKNRKLPKKIMVIAIGEYDLEMD
jgi:hypothetical protein